MNIVKVNTGGVNQFFPVRKNDDGVFEYGSNTRFHLNIQAYTLRSKDDKWYRPFDRSKDYDRFVEIGECDVKLKDAKSDGKLYVLKSDYEKFSNNYKKQ